ncbi:MAG: peptidoglycan editing factor PgeF [Candidatus Omnitrophica bacterium]|nr:peptidoglycan editing factor PgeF [Candidatus Omnitrophota bacterium]
MTPFFNNVFPPEVVTFISRRPEDFCLAAGQASLTGGQKNFLSAQLGFQITKAVNIRQVHGDRIIVVPKDKPYIAPQVLEEADGIVTDTVNLPVVVRTADCVPIFAYDPSRRKIGLFHAGWKGTAKEILLKGLRLMKARPQSVKIAFGPAIRACCYEIGGDVQACFPKDIIPKKGKHYLDLVEVNRNQALQSGVKEENVTDCGICTCCDENYFSYRRQGDFAGRMISLMMLKDH